MRNLVGTVLILVILVILGFLVAPYFMGGRAQQAFNQQIETYNKTSPLASVMTIAPESYQRHWFSSDATVKVTFHAPNSFFKENSSYTFNLKVKHGPVFTVNDDGNTRYHWGAGAILLKGDTTDFNGIILVSINWTKDPGLFADIRNLILNDQSHNTYTLKNLTFNTKEGSGANTHYLLTIPTITAQLKEGELTGTLAMNNLRLTTDGHDNNHLWLGTINFSMDKLAFETNPSNQPLAMLNDLTASLETKLSDNKTKTSSSFNFNIDSLDVMGNTIKPITVSYSIDGIDADAYRQLKVLGEQVQLSEAQHQQPPAQLILQMVEAAAKLLENGMTFTINNVYVGLPKSLASSPLSANAQLTVKPMNNLLDNLTNIIGAISKSQSPQQNRDQASSNVTGAQPQADSNLADSQQQLELQLMKSLPALDAAFTKAIAANGKASLPESLIKQLLLERYTRQLMSYAASGKNVTQTPQDLANRAFHYLVTNKMLIPANDGSMKIKFRYNNGQLSVNDQPPALQLPQPTVGTETPTIQTGS